MTYAPTQTWQDKYDCLKNCSQTNLEKKLYEYDSCEDKSPRQSALINSAPKLFT